MHSLVRENRHGEVPQGHRQAWYESKLSAFSQNIGAKGISSGLTDLGLILLESQETESVAFILSLQAFPSILRSRKFFDLHAQELHLKSFIRSADHAKS
jgi:hypothetical protein